ncbi:hypothetical protein NC652_022167 [Populus alba x Populus x berolinensis]|nr:hypothetical protein NC652_022167 [Populus alba x Populus x berolinensis]
MLADYPKIIGKWRRMRTVPLFHCGILELIKSKLPGALWEYILIAHAMFFCQNPLAFAHMLLAHANYNMYLVVTESLHPNTSSPLWSGLEGENLDYWKVVLILKEILVFMTDQFIVEPYFPDLFARQFGLCEDIPIPLLAKIVNVESLQMSSTYLELSPSCRLLPKNNIESNPYQEYINSRKPVLSFKEKTTTLLLPHPFLFEHEAFPLLGMKLSKGLPELFLLRLLNYLQQQK